MVAAALAAWDVWFCSGKTGSFRRRLADRMQGLRVARRSSVKDAVTGAATCSGTFTATCAGSFAVACAVTFALACVVTIGALVRPAMAQSLCSWTEASPGIATLPPDPKQIAELMARSELAYQERRDTEALASLREVLAQDPMQERAWFRLGNLMQRTGRPDAALAAYARAASVDPTHEEPHRADRVTRVKASLNFAMLSLQRAGDALARIDPAALDRSNRALHARLSERVGDLASLARDSDTRQRTKRTVPRDDSRPLVSESTGRGSRAHAQGVAFLSGGQLGSGEGELDLKADPKADPRADPKADPKPDPKADPKADPTVAAQVTANTAAKGAAQVTANTAAKGAANGVTKVAAKVAAQGAGERVRAVADLPTGNRLAP